MTRTTNVTIATYGDFENYEVKIKVLYDKDQAYMFQSILRSAGYDCDLHSLILDIDKLGIDKLL